MRGLKCFTNLVLGLLILPCWCAATSYQLSISASNPELVKVEAALTMNHRTLTMMMGGIPSEIAGGWTSFVTIKHIRTRSGDDVTFDYEASSGNWHLPADTESEVIVEYQVRLDHHQYDWSSVGGNDARPSLLPGPNVLWITKGLFILPAGSDLSVRSAESILVSFILPEHWKVSTAWLPSPTSDRSFQVSGFASLCNNLVMIGDHHQASTKFDKMSINWAVVPELGHRMDLFQHTLASVLPVYREIFGELPETNYLICATPNAFEDGEAFQNSFHQMFLDEHLEQRKIVWANVLAHEMFHYWNGTYFLRASDPQAQSWFSEGFTEYYSNLALIRAGVVSTAEFYQKLAFQFSRYFNARFLNGDRISLVQAGYQKNKYWSLLYGGGATTAFVLDVWLRSSHQGVSLDQVMHELYQNIGKKGVLVDQSHLLQALEVVTGTSYQHFFDKYINGAEVLPLLETCAKAGLSVAFYQGEFYLTPTSAPGSILAAILNQSTTGME